MAERSKLHGGGGNVRCPSHGRQIERIGPIFPVLEEELRKRKVQLTDNPESLDPEEVLEVLPSVTYQGVTGNIALDDIGDAIRDSAFVKKCNTETGLWDFVTVATVNK